MKGGMRTGGVVVMDNSEILLWGFYFVCVLEFDREVCFAKRYGLGCNLLDREEQKVAPTIVSFSVSVLAVVTNKVETPTCITETTYVGVLFMTLVTCLKMLKLSM